MVTPDFHTICQDMGWIPHRANTVRVAPVKTIIVVSIPISNLIISNFNWILHQTFFCLKLMCSAYRKNKK